LPKPVVIGLVIVKQEVLQDLEDASARMVVVSIGVEIIGTANLGLNMTLKYELTTGPSHAPRMIGMGGSRFAADACPTMVAAFLYVFQFNDVSVFAFFFVSFPVFFVFIFVFVFPFIIVIIFTKNARFAVAEEFTGSGRIAHIVAKVSV